MEKENKKTKLSFQQTWSMAVGGMIGGGIFSTLGVVVKIAGSWAWLSFFLAGLIALAAGYSYVKLASFYGEGGGAFTFLREINAKGFAGSLSWILVVGYILTNAVYAFTFGQYLGNVADLGPWFSRGAAVVILMLFTGLNLQGVGEAGGVETLLVWFKLIILVGLALWGLSLWNPEMLSQGVPDSGLAPALFGGACVFMAYEGFQLLTYDYEDIKDPDRTLPRTVLSAIITVIVVYIIVALGTTMLVGADQVVAHEEVALAIAGDKIWGTAGVVIVTIAAAASTGSAINSTLFATARLVSIVAKAGELPSGLARKNDNGIPNRAVICLGLTSAVLAAAGSLTSLVESASLAFLFTFAVVCGLAFRQKAGIRLFTGFGVLAAAGATVVLVFRLLDTNVTALVFFGILLLAAMIGRPLLLRWRNN